MRLYRLLLRLYPASFRHEYGGEMAAVFGERLRDAGGPVARAAVMAGAIPDVLRNALAVHGDILRQDLRYSVRALRRSRGFAFTAIAVIALGIGANTAAFSVTDFVLLRPLPFPAPERLVTVWERTEGYARMELSPATYRDWKLAATVVRSRGRLHDNVGQHAWQRRAGAPRRRAGHRRSVSDARCRGGDRPCLRRGR